MSTPTQLHDIRFPAADCRELTQDEAFFYLRENGDSVELRFHDYEQIYQRPGLYEQLFYQRLRCTSPAKAAELLARVLSNNNEHVNSLRVLDLGAGNGMVGELLDAARVVGIDISRSAQIACERDRPHAYDAYYVQDLSSPGSAALADLQRWNFNCMTCIAALGFGDIPVPAFAHAFNLVGNAGWVAFNIRDTFMSEADRSGFSRLIKHLLASNTMELHHLERYRHRLSSEGDPLFYYMLVGRKHADIDIDRLDEFQPPHAEQDAAA